MVAMSGAGGRSASRWGTAVRIVAVRRRHTRSGAKRSAEVEGLRGAQRLDGQHVLGQADRLAQMERRSASHGHVVLLVGAGRDRVDRRRMGQGLQLVDEGGRGVVGDHQSRVDPGRIGQEGRQSRQAGVHQARGAALGDRGQLGDRHGGVVEGERQRLAVEVAARHDRTRREDERVVGGGVDLDPQDALELRQRVARRAMDLRHAAQAVRVLEPMIEVGAVRLPDLAVAQELAKVACRRDLPGVWPRGDQRLLERGAGSEHRLEAHGADDVGGQRQAQRIVMGQAADATHELGPVEERQPFLGAELERFEARARQRRRPWPRAGTVHRGLALPDDDQCDVCQRGQVAGGTEASA